MTGTHLVQLWDGRHVPGRKRGDLYVFGFRQAPAGLATRRQLRAMGKRPGGQEVTALIEWRRGRRWAGLYRIDQARPVRLVTEAQRAAIAAALAARRTCRSCGQDAGYYLPRAIGQCWPCHLASNANNSTDPLATPRPGGSNRQERPAGPGLPTPN